MKAEKKKNIIIVGILLLLIIGILGVSYAVFSYTGRGERVNTITTGAISMSYEETDNIITIDGALPTTDATGTKRLKEGEYFDFTISSEITGNTNINYEISAKEVGEGTIDGSNIKLYLTKLTDDNNEEELMSPEVYNEEIDENTYTGRPSNEMSLYQGSMSSSESNRYRLRMYVDEGYNPQGDGGGLTFSVRINVYGKSGDKMPMQTGYANEVLLSKVNDEDLDYNTATEEQQKEMWTFTHTATEQTEALTDYRYIGANPNNYINFNDELWRIIGVFSVDDGTGIIEQRVKIIRNEFIGNIAWDSSNVNNWPTSTLNAYLNTGEYFTNSLGSEARSIIDNTLWYLGGTGDYSNTDNGLVEHFYINERGMQVYGEHATSWIGKVGLIYPSDYGYATSGGNTVDRNTCYNTPLYSWRNNFRDCYNNNWLYDSINYKWTLSPSAIASNYLFRLHTSDAVDNGTASNALAVYPVVFLKVDTIITDGIGSVNDPYILQK